MHRFVFLVWALFWGSVSLAGWASVSWAQSRIFTLTLRKHQHAGGPLCRGSLAAGSDGVGGSQLSGPLFYRRPPGSAQRS